LEKRKQGPPGQAQGTALDWLAAGQRRKSWGNGAELKEFCENRGWTCKVYPDGKSGAMSDRPALNEMLDDLRKRKINVIVVWAFDRLARSLKQLLSIAEECQSLGVDLVSLKQNVDTTLPAGRLTFHVLGAVAEFEREMLRERVRSGMARLSPNYFVGCRSHFWNPSRSKRSGLALIAVVTFAIFQLHLDVIRLVVRASL